MSNTTEKVEKQVSDVSDSFANTGRIVTDAAQEKLGQFNDQAAEFIKQGEVKVHGLACSCEQFVRAKPVRSVLMAVGVGWLLGRFWKR